MGTYYNPPMDVTVIGRELHGLGFDTLTGQLEDNECLVGLYDRGLFKNAVMMPDEREYHGFEQQVDRGIIIRMGFYAVPKWAFPMAFPAAPVED